MRPGFYEDGIVKRLAVYAALVLLASSAMGQGTSGIRPQEFATANPLIYGADVWREPVADIASLPACDADSEGHARWVVDIEELRVCKALAWTAPAGGEEDTTCLDGSVTCLFAGSASEGGPATTALALNANPANCPAGQWPAGIAADGTAEGCTPDATGTDDQTAGEVGYTPTTPADWSVAPDDVAGGLDTLAGDLAGLDTTADDLSDNSVVDLSDVTAISGNTTTLGTTSGTLTSGDCVEFDASGNLVASGGGCGGGASALGDLTNVSETGAGAGKPLVGDGAGGWLPASAFATNSTGAVLGTGAANALFDLSKGESNAAYARFFVASSRKGFLGIDATEDFVLTMEGANSIALKTNNTTRLAIGATDGRTTITSVLAITPQATAPATCTAATDIYTDTSGALCFCTATNTWTNVSGVGSCV